jgi:ubiquinone/menaquinone biosynthesis C-methylase UbiE
MNLQSVFDNPWVFALSQRLIPFTAWTCEGLIRRNVAAPPGARVLDIACGVGVHRKFFPNAEHVGIDVNPEYIARATRLHGSGFHTMDATRLEFEDASFDLTLCVAAFHHLDDTQASAVIRESFRVARPGGKVHIIDAVIAADPRAWVKRWVFANDRGRFQRTEQQMRQLAEGVAPIAAAERVSGRLHDVLYLRLDR